MPIVECKTCSKMGLIARKLRNARTRDLFGCLLVTAERVNFEVEHGNAYPLSKALVRSLDGPLRNAKKKLGRP